MSAKSTRGVPPDVAKAILHADIERISNETLSNLLNVLADSGESTMCSKLDHFFVSEFYEEDDIIKK